MIKAIEVAINGVKNNEGGPFGYIVVKDGEIIGQGNNKVTSTNDPKVHAEVIAIRDACKNIGSFQLEGCDIYTTFAPCPMYLGAIYWARPEKVYYGCNQINIGFNDQLIYNEIPLSYNERGIPFKQLARETALKVFKNWEDKEDKIDY